MRHIACLGWPGLSLIVGAFAGAVPSPSGGWTDRTPFPGNGTPQIHYYLYSPGTLERGRTYPLILWLHGGLKSNGTGGPSLPRNAFYDHGQQERNPCFVLRPVAVRGENWVSPRGAGTASHRLPPAPSPSMKLLVTLLEEIVRTHPVDRKRMIVCGASMGGYGTWDLITRHPDLFAAAIPICGGADPEKARLLSGMKIWAFHSADDRIVPVRGSREMCQALFEADGGAVRESKTDEATIRSSSSGRLRYTEFTRGGHNAWDRALGDPGVIEWVFEDGK